MIFLLTFIGVSACCSNADEKQVKGTIMRYDQLLAEGFLKLDMSPLQEVATPEQAQKEYYLMAALGEGKVRMESQLKEVEFLAVQFLTRSEALVTTREKWDYRHLDIRTGNEVKNKKDVIYELSYRLKKVGERWVVTSVIETAADNGKISPPQPHDRTSSVIKPRP